MPRKLWRKKLREEKQSEERRSSCINKSRNAAFFQWIKEKHTIVARSTVRIQVKMLKTLHCGSTFGSANVARCCGAKRVSKSRVKSAKNLTGSDRFWKFRCSKTKCCSMKHGSKSKSAKHTMFRPLLKIQMLKNARCCVMKYFSESKSIKHTTFGPVLEIQISKKSMPVWHEANFEISVENLEFGSLKLGS